MMNAAQHRWVRAFQVNEQSKDMEKAGSPNLILKQKLGCKGNTDATTPGTRISPWILMSRLSESRKHVCVSALLGLPCSGKKDVVAVTLSLGAAVWLKSPDAVSKIAVKKLKQDSWFICVFL